jgi:hypothetical protein
VLGVAGCADDAGSSESSGGSSGGESAAGETRIRTLASQTGLEGRDVIYTADVVIRASDVPDATDKAIAITEDVGGLLFQQHSDLEGSHEAELVLKVPPDQLDKTLASLSDLGRVLRNDLKAEDVTDQVTDLEGRLASAQASADRLRNLLGAADTTADVVAIEGELATREGEIESMQGQLAVLTSQAELATINLRLTERSDLDVNKDVPSFISAVRTGWVALVNVVLVVVAVLGFLLPFIPVLVLGWWLTRRFLLDAMKRALWPSKYAFPPPPPGPPATPSG